MTLDEMLTALDQMPGREFELRPQQRGVTEHNTGPLWVIAGPGSGKTEVLVLRCLRLVCVDQLQPGSIMITTFTERAAKNIQDRLEIYKEYLIHFDNSLIEVDLSRIRLGTLHSLCNEIMQEYRYTEYQNVRLLDDIEQPLFVYEHSILAQPNPPPDQLPLWQHFYYLVNRWEPVSGRQWNPNGGTPPSRWRRAHAAVILFNRTAEDLLDVNLFCQQGGVWDFLADAYDQYVAALQQHYRCDFAHLQQRFLSFLVTPRGRQFLRGDGTSEHPGLSHILVDEYQDTNPIQEAIYLKLAEADPHNLCVVGDDDQALYRFRGASVECMVNFGEACHLVWDIPTNQVRQIPLVENFRSHSQILDWCSDYIESFDVMRQEGVRAPGKQRLVARSSITGNHLAVGLLTRQRSDQLVDAFANLVQNLLQNHIIQNPNQCVLLLKSTRENQRWAGPYVQALHNIGIATYNPRSKALLQQEEVMAALGTLVEVLDPNGSAQAAVRGDGIQGMVNSWRNAYQIIATQYAQLRDYVRRAHGRISQIPVGQLITLLGDQGAMSFPATLQEVFYHILNHEPFVTWQNDPERTVRLGRLTKLLETYSSVPVQSALHPTRGLLRTSTTVNGEVSFQWRQNFYYSLVGLLVSAGLDEPEDEEEFFPANRLPIMTVHQVKGLEFPFVFVAGLGEDTSISTAHLLEDELFSFRQNNRGAIRFTPAERALQDLVRFYYVAYSRAQYALIFLATTSQLNQAKPAFGGMGYAWFRQRITIL